MCEICELFAADDEPRPRVFEASGEPRLQDAQRAAAAPPEGVGPERRTPIKGGVVGSTKLAQGGETTRA